MISHGCRINKIRWSIQEERNELRHFISEIFQPLNSAVKIYSDNQSAIAIAHGNQQHARTKHFDIRLYFIRDTIDDGDIAVQYLPTEQMLADILTKGLPSPRVKILTDGLGIHQA